MSKTPRTDEAMFATAMNRTVVVHVKFAQQLETELADAKADADHWKSECNALQRMVHEARAEIERLKCCTNCGSRL